MIVNDDNLLFIDPVLIEILGDQWGIEAKRLIQSFFDAFYAAYSEKDDLKKVELLSHAGEQNGTRFGYGRGNNGKGNTVNGLLDIFAPLENFMQEDVYKRQTVEYTKINTCIELVVTFPF